MLQYATYMCIAVRFFALFDLDMNDLFMNECWTDDLINPGFIFMSSRSINKLECRGLI